MFRKEFLLKKLELNNNQINNQDIQKIIELAKLKQIKLYI